MNPFILTQPSPCRVCRGTGRITVGSGRGELLTCPACASTEHAQPVTLTPHEALVSLAALGDPAAHTHVKAELSYPTQATAQATTIKKLRAIAYPTPIEGLTPEGAHD